MLGALEYNGIMKNKVKLILCGRDRKSIGNTFRLVATLCITQHYRMAASIRTIFWELPKKIIPVSRNCR